VGTNPILRPSSSRRRASHSPTLFDTRIIS
jgi:hypothetical protein